MKMMFFIVVGSLLITFIPSLNGFSDQQDLTIGNSSAIGCLKLKTEKNFLSKIVEEDFRSSYQTYSTPSMSVELCFRLCRHPFVIIFHEQNQCLCLHTVFQQDQIVESLGEILPQDQCRTSDGQIYSLTNDSNVLPALKNDSDWALDGCYYFDSIGRIKADSSFAKKSFPDALRSCKDLCSKTGEIRSFYLSKNHSCYCSLLTFKSTNQSIILRKPLSHCSFVNELCRTTPKECNKVLSTIPSNTTVKINVERRCPTIDGLQFIFDRQFRMCVKKVNTSVKMNFSQMVEKFHCKELTVDREGRLKSFLQSSWLNERPISLRIDDESLNSVSEFLQINSSNNFAADDICLSLTKEGSSGQLVSCSSIASGANFLCIRSPEHKEDDFLKINSSSIFEENEILTCPRGFLLFNRMCYSILTSFVYNRLAAEEKCDELKNNSRLVEFESHRIGNLDAKTLRGRTKEDSLLEFFFYQLENNLRLEPRHNFSTNHSLRLVLADQTMPDKCIIRYFVRSIGTFTTIDQCVNGGHPVCQYLPIRTKKDLPQTTTTLMTTDESESEETNATDSSILSTTATSVQCENCSSPVADLVGKNTLNTEKDSKPVKYRPLILLLAGPLLALILLLVGVIILTIYLRTTRGSYVLRHNSGGLPPRTSRSSTVMTNTDAAHLGAPTVHLIGSKPTSETDDERETLIPMDRMNGNGYTNVNENEQFEIISPTTISVTNPNAVRIDTERLLPPSFP